MRIARHSRIWTRLRWAVVIVSSLLLTAIGQAQTSSPEIPAVAQPSRSPGVALYAAVGAVLMRYDVDVDRAALVQRDSVTLPANVQYVWPHPSRRYLYVVWSGGASGKSQHGISAFRIDPASGVLQPHGPPVSLPSRPIHVTTDISGTHALVAYNNPSGVTVHQIAPDGTIVSQVNPSASLDAGIYAHQVRVAPSNEAVILVTRGNGPNGGKSEEPGALKVFGYKDGMLTPRASIAPRGGHNFQPRHLDFHPSQPWVFVSLERQNKLQVYAFKDGILGGDPLFTQDTLSDTGDVRPGQIAGTVHVHPGGRFVYVANRASGTTDFEGRPVFAGGENTIAVYVIRQDTGEPALIQSVDTRGMVPRTFALDPSGRILVVGNQSSFSVRDGDRVRTVPAGLAVFRVRDDGRLDFVRKYDVETGGGRSLFWVGMVPLP